MAKLIKLKSDNKKTVHISDVHFAGFFNQTLCHLEYEKSELSDCNNKKSNCQDCIDAAKSIVANAKNLKKMF